MYDACRIAATTRGRLADVLKKDARVTQRLADDAIEHLCDPANYLGAAPKMVDQVLAHPYTGPA
ncbi:3-carboxy-cis,cis-muconate cycloisomerase [compost metagenome]